MQGQPHPAQLRHLRKDVGGWTSYGLFYVAMGLLAGAGPAIYLLFGAYGVFMAATEGVEKALVADLAPKERVGSAFGWFNLAAGLMLFPASFLFGWLYESLGPLAAFLFSAGCALLAALLLAVWALPAPGSPDRGIR